MTNFINRRIQCMRAFFYRVENYRLWRSHGMDRKHAWRKADLTL